VQRRTAIALLIGVAAVIAAVVYAGTGAVVRSLQSLHVSGLLVLVLLHLPAVAMMGFAWWLAAGDDPPASPARFLWARFVRDAAGELLPFLQLGGVVFGLRALGRGRAITLGAISASIDGVIELMAKLPYALAALLALLALVPQSPLTRVAAVALAATTVLVAVLMLARRSLTASLAALARAISARWPAVLALEGGHDVEGSFDRIFTQRGRLWWAFALHLGCWFFGAAEAWVMFRLLGTHLSFWQALAIDGTVAGLRTFGWIVPGAAGVQEVSYMLAAAVFGVPPAAAVAASFARRARDLALGIATLGIAAVADANLTLPPLSSLRQPPRALADRSVSETAPNRGET
jgi:putative membrane protein